MKNLIVLESNQRHATITSNGICPTLSASMGMGGGYVPMVVVDDNSDREEISRVSQRRYSCNIEKS